MIRLTDGKRTIEITMATWDGNSWSPDWSQDFFTCGDLKFDEETNAYIVENVDFCIEGAKDWKNGKGDHLDERLNYEEFGMKFDPDDRLVDITEI